MTTLHEVVAYYLLQPIASLLERFDDARQDSCHFHSKVTIESGFAAASIELIVTMLESYTVFGEYLADNQAKPVHPIDFAKSRFPSSLHCSLLAEVYAVRHAICHGHMWRRTVEFDYSQTSESLPFPSLEISDFEMHDGFGSQRSFFENIDKNTRKTKVLGMNIIATRLTKADTKIALGVAVKFLVDLGDDLARQLAKPPESTLNLSNQLVVFRNSVRKFPSLLEDL